MTIKGQCKLPNTIPSPTPRPAPGHHRKGVSAGVLTIPLNHHRKSTRSSVNGHGTRRRCIPARQRTSFAASTFTFRRRRFCEARVPPRAFTLPSCVSRIAAMRAVKRVDAIGWKLGPKAKRMRKVFNRFDKRVEGGQSHPSAPRRCRRGNRSGHRGMACG